MALNLPTSATSQLSDEVGEGKQSPSRRMRILFLTISPPIPPTSGDRQRTNLLFHTLERLGKVDLCVFDRESETGKPREELEQNFNLVGHARPTKRGEHWPWRLIRWVYPHLVDRLAHNVGQRQIDYRPDPPLEACVRSCLARQSYDVIVCRYLKTAAKSGVLGKARVIVDVDDLDTHVYASRLKRPGLAWWRRAIIRRHLKQLERIVEPLLLQAQGLWVASRLDEALLRHTNVKILPNIPFGQIQKDVGNPSPSGKNIVLMVGTLSGFGAAAVDRFLVQCWPAIRRARPDAIFRIVGVAMAPKSHSRWASVEGVEPIGYAPDLSLEYARCAFAVSPLFEGAGTKIKVLEPFLYGRTIVAAQPSLRGYEHVLRDGDSLMVAENESQLSAACIVLLADPGKCELMARRGLEVVRRHFSFEAFSAPVAAMVLGAKSIPADATDAKTAPIL